MKTYNILSISEFKTNIGNNSRLLGIDPGSKNIGFAICDEGKKVATPLKIIKKAKLKNLIKENDNSLFFVGENISIADLAIWRLLGWFESGIIDGVPRNILEPYENLKKMRNEIYKHPKANDRMIKTYGKVI